MTYRRPHKYHAKPTVYKGRMYDSKAEAEYAAGLDMDRDIAWWLRQVSFDLGEDTRYRADFLVADESSMLGSGTDIYAVDVKGVETAAFRKIKKLWRKYGPVPLHVVKRGKTVEVIERED